MLEKRIIEKLLEKMDVVDPKVAKLMVERTGIIFTFDRGISGQYINGMLRPTGSKGLIDFDPEAITGFIVSDIGVVQDDLSVDAGSQLQDLQNQVVQLTHAVEAGKEVIARNAVIIRDQDQLIRAANETINEMRKEAQDVANLAADLQKEDVSNDDGDTDASNGGGVDKLPE